MSSPRDRLEKVLEHTGCSYNSLAKKIGLKRSQNLYDIRDGKIASISFELAVMISNAFPDISTGWLMMGTGEMIQEPMVLPRERIPALPTPTLTTEDHGVPYYDIDFIGGFDQVYNEHTVKPSYFIDFPPYNDCDYWINVTGKSMGPLIAHGDIVALKKLNNWREFLLMGEIYAVITDEFRTIKILGAGEDDDHYTLIPYNKGEGYSKQAIPKHLIKNVFRVKGAIKKFF